MKAWHAELAALNSTPHTNVSPRLSTDSQLGQLWPCLLEARFKLMVWNTLSHVTQLMQLHVLSQAFPMLENMQISIASN